MTDKLPINLQFLFQPRLAQKFLPHQDFSLEDRRVHHIDGVSAFLPALKEEPVPYNPTESWLERKNNERIEKEEASKRLYNEEWKEQYKPKDDPKATGNAINTIFVGRLPYQTTESDLRNFFGTFGTVTKVRLVVNEFAGREERKRRPHKGYAFVEFSNEYSAGKAKDCSPIVLKDRFLRNVIIDVERGRTIKDWRPRRFGGGLGGRGLSKVPPNNLYGRGPRPNIGPPRDFAPRGYNPPFRGRDFSDRGPPHGGRFGGANGSAPAGAPLGPRGRGPNDSNNNYGGPRNYDRYGGGGGGGGGGDRGPRFDDRRPPGGSYDRNGGDRDRGGYDRGGGDRSGFDRNRGERANGVSGTFAYRDRDRDNEFSERPNNHGKRTYEGSGGYDESRQRRRY